MKEIYITLVLFFLLLGGIVLNNIYMNAFYEEFGEMLDSLPAVGESDCRARLYELAERWNEKRLTVSIGVSYDDIERVSERIRLLTAAAENGDALEFELQRRQLATAIGHVTRLERLSVESIF